MTLCCSAALKEPFKALIVSDGDGSCSREIYDCGLKMNIWHKL